MTRAERNIQWIEAYCKVPDGADVTKPMILREWQREILRMIYDNPATTRRAFISMPRKNGKTALIACLLLLHLAGPEAKINSQLYSAAISREQASTVFKLAAKMARLNPELKNYIIVRDTAKEMVCEEIGTFYGALSADSATAHGKSPIFAVHDELGQVKKDVSELYEAIETGMAAHDAPLSIVISTQAPNDDMLLSRLLDDAMSSRDPSIVAKVYAAPEDADPFCEETLKAANPAWGDFLKPKIVLEKMEGARQMASDEASYRNLHLNQRVSINCPFVSSTIGRECSDKPESLDGLEVYAGLDLSATQDLTALVLIGQSNGAWNVLPSFWLPGDIVEAKARTSGWERFPQWVRDGYLMAAPGKSVDYSFVAGYLRECFDRYNIVRIAFDDWKFDYLTPWLIKAGFTEEELETRFVNYRQGYKSMSPALRDLESELVNSRIRHGMHPVLTWCASNAVVKSDDAENRKLVKLNDKARIDGMVALTMAMGVAPMMTKAPESSVYESRGLLSLRDVV